MRYTLWLLVVLAVGSSLGLGCAGGKGPEGTGVGPLPEAADKDKLPRREPQRHLRR